MELRIRDVFSAEPPLVGPFTRIGGNHPGPALFYVLAIPYRLLGSEPWGLLVGAALINGVCIALAIRIAGRRGHTGLAALLAGLTLAAIPGLEVEHLRDIWNPHLPLFAFLLAAIATWASVVGSRWSIPVAGVASSFALQSHFGYLFLVGVLALWAGAAVWLHRRHWREWRASVLFTVVLVAAMWTPPLAQQLFGDQGNLTRVVRSADDIDEAKYGIAGIEEFLLPHLGPTPAWFRVTPDDFIAMRGRRGLTWPPLGLLTFAAGVGVAARRRDREPLFLAAVTASLWVAGAVSLSQLSGLPAPYLYRWVRVLGILLWAAALWPLGRALLARAGEARRNVSPLRVTALVRRSTGLPGGLVGVVALAALAVWLSAGQTGTAFASYRQEFRQAGVLADEALAAVQSRVRPGSTVEVQSDGTLVFDLPAVVADLERAGYQVTIDGGAASVWGAHRVSDRTSADLVVLVKAASTTTPPPPELRRVATVDMLTAEQRRTYRNLPSVEFCESFDLLSDEPRPVSQEVVQQCVLRSQLAQDDRIVEVWVGPPQN